MIYHGRHIDVLSLWGQYIDIPPGIESPLPTYLPKVKCPNPKHDTHKAHFQVNTKKPLVHCFAKCGIQGTYEHAIMVITGCTEKEARRAIIEHSRVPTSKDITSAGTVGVRKSVAYDDILAVEQRKLEGGMYHYLPKEARAWLDKRGVDQSTRGKWRIGYDEDIERIVYPAYDERNIFRFLIKRRIDGAERLKYLYTEGAIKTSLLYGACMLDREQLSSTGLALCEGSVDTWLLHQNGVRIATAILGTGLSTKQVRLIDKLDPKRIFLFFDRDAAGIDNILDCQVKLKRWPLFVCRYRNGKTDPGEMRGNEALTSLDRALPMALFLRKARNAGLTRKVA